MGGTMVTESTFAASKSEARGERAMVATKHRLASAAALRSLRAGGNVMDAAVAAAFAVGVVEPSSSGIGGGGYLVYQMGERGGVFAFPMRASLAAAPDMYRLTGVAAVGAFGWPGVEDNANLEGPRSIATPGAVAGLAAAHAAFGRLPLDAVVAPAVELAQYGFAPEFHDVMAFASQVGKLTRYRELRRTFLPAGELPSGIEIPGSPYTRGDVLRAAPVRIRQPDLGDTLAVIGREGADAFYRGKIARRLVDAVREEGGILDHADLENYRPLHWQTGADPAPLEVAYRGDRVRVAPFASGGITSAMTLQLLSGSDLSACEHNDAEALHRYICAARLAYADRYAYLADPETADVPWRGLTSPSYAARRQAGIGDKAPARFKAGDPWREEGRKAPKRPPGSAPAYHDGTTHLCVMDGDGNAVSLTNTLGSGFGSGVVAGRTGVILNNGMMWVDPVPGHVNSIAPGKQPLNNMSPMLVLGDGGARLGGRRLRRPAHHQLRHRPGGQDARLRPGPAGRDRRAAPGLQHAADRRRRPPGPGRGGGAASPPPPRGGDRPALHHRGHEPVRQPAGHHPRPRRPARRRRHLPHRPRRRTVESRARCTSLNIRASLWGTMRLWVCYTKLGLKGAWFGGDGIH